MADGLVAEGLGLRALEEIITTTTYQGDPASEARAREVAARCGLVFVPRTDSVARLVRLRGADGAYVVGPARVELRGRGLKILVHAGTYPLVEQTGRAHPLLRAVAPLDEDPPETIVDATLGLAKDAIHMAGILGARVIGLERVRLLVCLAEDGLARLAAEGAAWSKGAARVEPHEADAREWLAAQPARSVDVVYLDPMFPRPVKSPWGFALFRTLADAAPLSEELLREALRVARRRVVLKVARGAEAAAAAPLPEVFTERVEGKRLDWLVARA
ncbi:MAG: class I SAM-dependent methyltransferase [Planctomycetota bacterium]